MKIDKFNFMVGVAGLAIGINVVQFSIVDNGLPRHLRAIYVNSGQNIITLANQLTNVNNVHNLYFSLRLHARGAIIYVNKDSLAVKNRNFLSGIYGISDSRFIKTAGLELSSAEKAINSKATTRITGEVWDNPGHPKHGIPGETWEIILDKNRSNATKLLMIESDQSPNYTFIDLRLLPESYKKEAGL